MAQSTLGMGVVSYRCLYRSDSHPCHTISLEVALFHDLNHGLHASLLLISQEKTITPRDTLVCPNHTEVAAQPYALYSVRLDLRLLFGADPLNALGWWMVPATVLEVVLHDVEVNAFGVNTGNGALGDVVLVMNDQPVLEPEILPQGNSSSNLAQLVP